MQIVLSELQKDPKFDVNAPILQRPSSAGTYERALRTHMRLFGDLSTFPFPMPGIDPFDFGDDEDIPVDEEEDGDAHMEDSETANVPAADGVANRRRDATANEAANNGSRGRREGLTAVFRRMQRVVGLGSSDGDEDQEAAQREGEPVAEGEGAGDSADDSMDETTSLVNIAVGQGGIEVLKILFDLGATPPSNALHKAVYYIGKCIHSAVISESVRMLDMAPGMSCLEALLDTGVDVNAIDPATETTALHEAVEAKGHEALSLLLERGANPAIRNRDNQTAADIAKESEDAIAVEILAKFQRLARLSTFNRSASQRQRNESQENADELTDDLVCVTCLTERKEVILAPCGHKIMCRRCTKRLFTRPEAERRCPLCRSTLESFVLNVFES